MKSYVLYAQSVGIHRAQKLSKGTKIYIFVNSRFKQKSHVTYCTADNAEGEAEYGHVAEIEGRLEQTVHPEPKRRIIGVYI